ncbi:MAG: FGGY-family carbohydrate kinase [Haloferacaceae archaeon]
MSYLLGVDAGLTNTKAAVFDSTGSELTLAVRKTPNTDTGADRAERDLEAFWETVAECISSVVADGPATAREIEGVGVAGHGHGLYLLDAAGDPVRDGIESTDSRAAALNEEWTAAGTDDAIFDTVGYEPFVADPISLLAWLERNEPERYGRIDTVLFCKDYLKFRLTGECCTDEMEASVFEAVETGEYARRLFERLGMAEVTDALPSVVAAGEQMGTVTPAAAEATGLAAGTPVASGLHDVGAAALGSGVYGSGQAMFVVGTWGQSIVVGDDPAVDRAVGGIPRRYLDGYLSYKGNRSAATCLDWFAGEFGDSWRAEAEARGVSEYQVYDEAVAETPVGAEGVVFHPYLHGTTDNPRSRGGFYGLAESHTRRHMLRAIYEGVAITQCERLRELASDVGSLDVRIAGGSAKSEVWTQIFADVLGEPIRVPGGDEPGARGAAVCAAVATGVYQSPRRAVEEMVEIRRTHRPDPGNVDRYRDVRDAFETARAALTDTWEQLNRIRAREHHDE